MEKIKTILKKLSYNSPVILSFTFLSGFVLLLNIFTKGQANVLLFSVYRSSLTNPLFYVRLFGHVLGHADWNHFYSNFLIILLIGPMLEEKYGSKNMLIMIVFTALVTGILNLAFFETGLLGASGIAFMLILLSSFTNFQKGTIPLTFLLIAGAYIGREIYDMVLIKDNISQITHIVGGICGAAFGWWLNKKK